jgi:hypothetical protein
LEGKFPKVEGSPYLVLEAEFLKLNMLDRIIEGDSSISVHLHLQVNADLFIILLV